MRSTCTASRAGGLFPFIFSWDINSARARERESERERERESEPASVRLALVFATQRRFKEHPQDDCNRSALTSNRAGQSDFRAASPAPSTKPAFCLLAAGLDGGLACQWLRRRMICNPQQNHDNSKSGNNQKQHSSSNNNSYSCDSTHSRASNKIANTKKLIRTIANMQTCCCSS